MPIPPHLPGSNSGAGGVASPQRYAVCVGCNYPSKAFGLTGAVNDAFLIAETLQRHYGFEPEYVTLLHDMYPGQKRSVKVEPHKLPTRRNILQAASSLCRLAKPGDVVFFSFSGYGLQVDDMQGQEDSLYEAILPTDFMEGVGEDTAVILTSELHDILLGVTAGVAVTVVLDCDHASSFLDMSKLEEPVDKNQSLKASGLCGLLQAHSAKAEPADHNKDVWQDDRARTKKARPRFQRLVEVDNPRRGKMPSREGMSRAAATVFALTASCGSQTALEMLMPAGQEDGAGAEPDAAKCYGVLSWSFVKALEQRDFNCTYAELIQGIVREIEGLKEKELQTIDQKVKFSYSKPHAKPAGMRVFEPVSAEVIRQQLEEKRPPAPKFAVVAPPRRGEIETPSHLPPPPPPAPPRLGGGSELVYHDLVGDVGGSFAVSVEQEMGALQRLPPPPPANLHHLGHHPSSSSSWQPPPQQQQQQRPGPQQQQQAQGPPQQQVGPPWGRQGPGPQRATPPQSAAARQQGGSQQQHQQHAPPPPQRQQPPPPQQQQQAGQPFASQHSRPQAQLPPAPPPAPIRSSPPYYGGSGPGADAYGPSSCAVPPGGPMPGLTPPNLFSTPMPVSFAQGGWGSGPSPLSSWPPLR